MSIGLHRNSNDAPSEIADAAVGGMSVSGTPTP